MMETHAVHGAGHGEVVNAGGLDWFVYREGSGSPILLLHGTGATHRSWAPLFPHLVPTHRVVAVDLPGHGQTPSPGFERVTLRGVTAQLHALLHALGVQPAGVFGHSAGAAIMLQLAAEGALNPDALLVGVNPALRPPHAAARAVMGGPVGDLLRSRFTRSVVRELGQLTPVIELLLSSTGSRLTPEQEGEYTRALQNPHHVEAAYAMMANWDLDPLVRVLPQIAHRTRFIVGDLDRWVPPAVAESAARRMPQADVSHVAGAGHLVHEEQPAKVATFILPLLHHARITA